MTVLGTPVLVDAAERECAANDLSTTYLVEAAAGTGKTTLLVSRILTIVRETLTPLSRVVAITFTEKAAGELKIKLRERLEAGARGSGEEAERYRHALTDLDAMPVSTIHAFCRELISQRPVEAGVEPGFALADEATSRMLQDEFWQTWITEQFAGDCPPARPFLERGIGLDSDEGERTLRTLFDLLNSYREELGELHVPCDGEAALAGRIREFAAEVTAALRLVEGCRDERDSLAQEIRKLGRWFESARWDTVQEALASLERHEKPHGGRKGRKDVWDPARHEAAKQYFLGDFERSAASLAAALTSHLAAPLVTWLKDAVRAYRQLKTQRNLLDFHDLLIFARDMLRHSRAAREYFKSRFDYLLVDEFQDTDPLQTEIVFFLAERAERFADDWREAELEHGKLFIVGDPKQSIYRFRRADLDLYGAVRERIEECGACLPIRVNFRSDPRIIGEVNAIFSGWMAGPLERRYEPGYVAMDAARDRSPHGAAVVLLPPPPSFDLDGSVQQLAVAEAACLAEYIAAGVRTARLSVQGNGASRPLSYRDVAILYSTTTHLGALESALRARGIPYQVTGGKDLPKRSEIQALRTVLAALDNPLDKVAVIGALRSPFFGCSDEELLGHRLDGGRFDYTAEQPAAPHLARAFGALRELHERCAIDAPSEVIGALFGATGGLQVYALKPQGESRAANLLKVLDLARSFEGGGSHSLHRLVRWLDRMEELRVGEDDAPIAESGDDVVQLMTFHKAKGLEFPVVLLYRLAQDRGRSQSAALIGRAQRAVEFRIAGLETAGYAAALEEEQDREWHEAMRLFYVAMTRARERLVLPVYWSRRSQPTDGQWFFRLLGERCPQGERGLPVHDGTAFESVDTTVYDLGTTARENLVLDVAPDDSVKALSSIVDHESWRRARDQAAAGLLRSRRLVRPSDHGTVVPIPHDGGQEFRQTEGKRFGEFVHAAMERVALPGAENLCAVLDEAAAEFGIGPTGREDGERLLQAAVSSDFFTQRVLRAGRLFRELPFAVELDGRMTEGSMDLVFLERGRPVIVDFKSDRVRAEDVPFRAETYLHQAAAYARALEAILHGGQPEVLLYFLRPGTLFAFSPERLRAAVV